MNISIHTELLQDEKIKSRYPELGLSSGYLIVATVKFIKENDNSLNEPSGWFLKTKVCKTKDEAIGDISNMIKGFIIITLNKEESEE